MASEHVERKLRIVIGLVVIALAAISLLTIGRTAPGPWYAVLHGLLCALLVVWGALVLVGKIMAERLVRTRRRWKYAMVIGFSSVFIILSILAAMVIPERAGGNRALPLFPAIIGLFVAQLYEPESGARFSVADLSDRDAKTWKAIALVPAVVGTALGCIAGAAAAAGDTSTAFTLLSLALPLLAFAAVFFIALGSRNRQLRAKP